MVKRKIASLVLRRDVDKWLGFLHKLGSQFLIDYSFPLLLYLELTRNCNYACPMCSRKENPLSGYMSLEVIRKVVKEAPRHTAYCLHMFGEPLLHPQFIEACKIIKEKKGNIIILTTNGYYLNEELIKRINAYVDKIYLSLHSLISDKYYNCTGKKGNLLRVVNNIDTFYKVGSKNKMTVRLYDGNVKPNEWKYEVKPYHNYGGERKEWSGLKDKKRYPCFHPWFTLAIAVNGDIMPCCGDVRHRLKLGNIKDDNLEDVWKGGRLSTIRNMHLFETIKGVCEECDQWQYRPNIFF